ncbi:MAG: FHA domain-containing protein [Oligoflexia bacterium]|nr:FHA domain-containing protein [Oligoflexia bacterium]MBF0364370.1 FHA domain-containing protein [Oligoflexia bacterium]
MKLSVFQDNQIISEVTLGEDSVVKSGDASEYFIGRNKDCHLVLDGPLVSRQHAVVRKFEDRWEIANISTFAPLIINGQSIDKKLLDNGDMITIGPYLIGVFFSNNDFTNVPVKTTAFTTTKKVETSDAINASDQEPSSEQDKSSPQNLTIEADQEENSDAVKESDNMENDLENSVSMEKNDELFSLDNSSAQDNFDSNANSDGDNNHNNDSNNNLSDDQLQLPDSSSNDMSEGTSAENAMDRSTRVITNFAQFRIKIFGEYAPYDTYLLVSPETFIGRDAKKCQIILSDPEVSSVHAVIKKTAQNLILQDLNSANGTMLAGARINQAEIGNGDEFIIGSTSFTIEILSELIESEKQGLMPVAENQQIEVQEIIEEEVDFAGGSGNSSENSSTATADATPASSSNSLFSKDALRDPAKRKKLIYIIAGIAVVAVLLSEPEEEKKPPVSEKDKAAAASQARLLKKDELNATPNGTPEASKSKKKLTPEEREYLEKTYILAKTYFENGKFKEADLELNKIFEVSEDGYKGSSQLRELIKKTLSDIVAKEEQKRKEIEAAVKKEKIKELLAKATEAVKEHKVEVAENLFNKILEIDPEQPDVSFLRLDLSAWKKEQERLEVEKAAKEADRKRKIEALSEGKNLYLKKSWYLAIDRLDKFLLKKDMDEDLIKEANAMLEDSKTQLKNKTDPLIGKAKSLKEGQDLKGAYENYIKVLKVDPANSEALNEVIEIRDLLDTRARKVYREALISESLSLFEDAKEKLQEVMQNSPEDSAYYKKAKDKLKNYLNDTK